MKRHLHTPTTNPDAFCGYCGENGYDGSIPASWQLTEGIDYHGVDEPAAITDRMDNQPGLRFALIRSDTWTAVGRGLEVQHTGGDMALVTIRDDGTVGFPKSDFPWLVRATPIQGGE